MALHKLDSIERFERADEDRGGDSGGFADDVEHEMRAIIEKNVGVAAGEIHGANARRGAAEMVAGGIAGRISFGFDDSAGEASFGEIVDDYFADEEACEGDGAVRKFGTAKAADGEFCAGFAHGGERLSTGCGARSGREFLEVVGGNEIVSLGVFANVCGDVGAQWHDAKMIGAGEIERGAGKLCGEALAFEGRGNLGMREDDAVRETSIVDEGAKSVYLCFEAMSFFVVDDRDFTQV